MAILTLSARQRAELEYLVAHTPLAKERSRAQAILWPGGMPTSSWACVRLGLFEHAHEDVGMPPGRRSGLSKGRAHPRQIKQI